MAKLILKDLGGKLDGEYEFDISYFTMRELHTIKRIAGVRAGELGDALEAGDSDAVVAMATVALNRHGIDDAEDRLWNSKAGQITIVADDEPEEDDGSPPA